LKLNDHDDRKVALDTLDRSMSEKAVAILRGTIMCVFMMQMLGIGSYYFIIWIGLPTIVGVAGGVVSGGIGVVGTLKAIAADKDSIKKLKPWPPPPALPPPAAKTVWKAWVTGGKHDR